MLTVCFKEVLKPGRYAYWKGLFNYEFTILDLNKVEITEVNDSSLFTRPELQPYIRSYSVEPHEYAILYINSKMERVLEPGAYYFWRNQVSVLVQKADRRQQQMEVSGQEILTKDKANIRVSFYVIYKVTDVMKALRENKEYEKQFYVLAQLALREYIGAYTLDELLEKRNDIASAVIGTIKEKALVLGIEIFECGIRDIILPGDMKEIINQVLIAEKKAQANIVTRREETASTRSLLNTAKLMEENEMLFRLKEMEYVEKIADKINGISISGNGDLVGQLKQIFVPAVKK